MRHLYLGVFFTILSSLSIGLCKGAFAEEDNASPPIQKPIEKQITQEGEPETYAMGTTQRTDHIHPSLWGQAGLFRVRSAESLPQGALTFGIAGEFYSISNGPLIGGSPNAASSISESLFVGYSPWKDWTLSVQRRNSSTTFAAPGAADQLISSLGDFTLSGAYSYSLSPSMAVSPFLNILVASNFNNLAPSGNTVSAGLGGAFTYNLFPSLQIPFFLHGNITYTMPQVRSFVPAVVQPETFFRFSRFNSVDIALGAEYVIGDFMPFFEAHTEVEFNSGLGFADPTYFSAGFRTTPFDNKSLAFLLGVDWAVQRTNVPGVAFIPPVQILGMLSYTFGLSSTERVHYYTTQDVHVVNRKFVIKKNINFQVGKAILLSDSTQLLDQIADVIKQNNVHKLLIVGHTDSTHGEAYNLKLSQDRAETVKTYLVHKGIPADSLVVQGYGRSKPKATNATEEGRALNRRVEFFILE